MLGVGRGGFASTAAGRLSTPDKRRSSGGWWVRMRVRTWFGQGSLDQFVPHCLHRFVSGVGMLVWLVSDWLLFVRKRVGDAQRNVSSRWRLGSGVTRHVPPQLSKTKNGRRYG